MNLGEQLNVDTQLKELKEDNPPPKKRIVSCEKVQFDYSHLDDTRDKSEMFVSFIVFSNEIKIEDVWKKESFMVLQESPNEVLSWVKYGDKKLFDTKKEAIVIVKAICNKLQEPYRMKRYTECSNRFNRVDKARPVSDRKETE